MNAPKLRPSQISREDMQALHEKHMEKHRGPAPKAKRNHAFNKESLRKYALCCLVTLAELRQSDRKRVLQHALKLNRV